MAKPLGSLIFGQQQYANGHATECFDDSGNITAQSGDLARAFPFRFSTKCFDAETSLY